MSRGNYKDGVFNLHVAFASDVTEEQIGEWKRSFAQASRLLFKATHGQMRFGTISYDSDARCAFADAWLLGRKGRSDTNGRIFTVTGQMNLRRDVRLLPYIIVHEFGHYALDLGDEYEGTPLSCIPWADSAKAHACIMQWPRQYGDRFEDGKLTKGVVYNFCSDANRREHADESCWDHIHSRYPNLTIPKVDQATSESQGVPVLEEFTDEPPDEINWVEAKCGAKPLVYLDPDRLSPQLGEAVTGAMQELSGLSAFKRLGSLDEVTSERNIEVCAKPLILPVSGPIDFETWSKLLEGSRIRAFPIAVADSEADLAALSKLSELSHGRLKIFSPNENLHFRVQSYLAEIATEMDCDAGVCHLMDTIFAAEPAEARQGALVPVEEFAESVTFVLSLDGDMDTIFSVVDPSGNRHNCSPRENTGSPSHVRSISIDKPAPGNWTVELGRRTSGEERRGTLRAVIVNHDVTATFEAHPTKDGRNIQLSVRGYHRQFPLTGLHVQARTVGSSPHKFQLSDQVSAGCSADDHDGTLRSNGQYSATLPANHKIEELIITVSNSGQAYSAFWAALHESDEIEPTVPRFFRTQRVSVTPAAK